MQQALEDEAVVLSKNHASDSAPSSQRDSPDSVSHEEQAAGSVFSVASDSFSQPAPLLISEKARANRKHWAQAALEPAESGIDPLPNSPKASHSIEAARENESMPRKLWSEAARAGNKKKMSTATGKSRGLDGLVSASSSSEHPLPASDSRSSLDDTSPPEAGSDLRWVMIKDGMVHMVSPAYVMDGKEFEVHAGGNPSRTSPTNGLSGSAGTSSDSGQVRTRAPAADVAIASDAVPS